jgi:3-dehydroquinate synthase
MKSRSKVFRLLISGGYSERLNTKFVTGEYLFLLDEEILSSHLQQWKKRISTDKFTNKINEKIGRNRKLLGELFKYPNHIIFYPQSIENSHVKLLRSTLNSLNINFILERIKDGESAKNLKNVESIYHILYKHDIKRNDMIVAFGGGTLSDIVGYAAATYLRGVNYGVIPTTLIAQCDAAIGGKCGVNFGVHKNRIGTFYQPKWVVVDTSFLKTLKKRELADGYAEMFKYVW